MEVNKTVVMRMGWSKWSSVGGGGCTDGRVLPLDDGLHRRGRVLTEGRQGEARDVWHEADELGDERVVLLGEPRLGGRLRPA